jgi:Rrf2 family protein
MLRLSKKADYALIAVSYMALPGQRAVASAREIAESHDLPLELLAKVLQQLVRKGIVRSVQGINGGYCLSRSPLETSVADIVEAIDGPLTLTACADEHEACGQYSKCNIRDPLHRIRERIASSLAACSVADLAADRNASAPAAAPARLWTTRGDSSQGSA